MTPLAKNWEVFGGGLPLDETVINARFLDDAKEMPAIDKIFYGKNYPTIEQFASVIESTLTKLNLKGYKAYINLNPIKPDFAGKACRDVDILERKNLLIDIDGVSDIRQPATDEEVQQALDLALEIETFLTEAGFSTPAITDSGNGIHLYYHLRNFDNDKENQNLIKRFLHCLAARYDNDTHKVDKVVHNASRISKAIGTLAYKGEATKDRPVRTSALLSSSEGSITPEELIKFIEEFESDEPIVKLNGAEPPSPFANREEGVEFIPNKPLLPEELDRQRFKEALENFSPDDYRGDGKITGDGGDWLGVMFAGASIGAVEELREWSKQSKEGKYDPVEFEDVIKSYGKNTGNPLTVRSFYSHLRGERKSNAAGKLGDIANGELYAEQYRDTMLFVRDTDDVYRFDPNVGWLKASTDYAIRNAKLIANMMTKQAFAAKARNPDSPSANKAIAEANRTSQKTGLVNMVWSARSCEGMSVDASELDSEPHLLGVKNGILNLNTRELLEPNPSILVTKRANVIYDPEAKAPRYIRFLNECNPNKEEIKFYIRWCGYRMSGYTTEQKYIFMKGVGGNGKSKDLELSLFILGDYADTFKTEVLVSTARDPQGHDADLLHFKGLRFAWCNETSEGKFLNEQAVKQIVDDGTVTGRTPYGKKQISFPMTAKIQIAGNHAPIVRGTDEGIWRRTLLFNWPTKFHDPSKTYPEDFKGLFRDADLLPKLTAEASGILNLWLAGYKEWKELGHLQIPDSIIKATNAYRDENDIFKQFLSDCCDVAPTHTENKEKLWWKFNYWSEAGNYGKVTKSSFNRMLRERELMTMNDRRTVKGLSLRDEHPF